MTDAMRGVLAAVGACMIWGLQGLYYQYLNHVPAVEVMGHRTLWSMVFFVMVLWFQGRLREVAPTLSTARSFGVTLFCAIMVACNWFLFIFSVQNGHVTEASFGYFIFPLVAVSLGVLIFKERLGRAQMVAVLLAAMAVVILTVGQGVLPWIALTLAVTFGFYSMVKKTMSTGSVVSVTAETIVLLPVSIGVLWWFHADGGGAYGTNVIDSILLMVAGPLTATPLILFSYAARRVNLATVGVIQYLNPILQFLVATLAFGEPFGFWKSVAFPIIWVALVIYTVAALRQDRAERRQARRSSTVSTT